MENRKTDRRITRTLRMIDEALIGLLEKKPIGEISVTELCEAADINRNTFYSHYSTPQDVLSHLEQEMMEKISYAVSSDSSSKDSTEIFTRALYSEPKLAKVLLSENAGTDLRRMITSASEARSLEIARKESSRLAANYQVMLADFSIAGGSAVIRRWVSTGMKEPPEDIAKFIRIVSNSGSRGIQNDPDPEFR